MHLTQGLWLVNWLSGNMQANRTLIFAAESTMQRTRGGDGRRPIDMPCVLSSTSGRTIAFRTHFVLFQPLFSAPLVRISALPIKATAEDLAVQQIRPEA
jgi:hypothetical protein